MPRLLLVRHGLTDYNTNRRFAGCTNIDLSLAGLHQVEFLKNRLAGDRISTVYTSDLRRARTTAEIIVSGHDHLEIIPSLDLREMDYGSCEGLTFGEIAERFPEVAASMRSREVSVRFPSGEGFSELGERASRFIKILKSRPEQETILVVSHSGPLRALICVLLRISLKHWWQFNIDNASLTIVDMFSGISILNCLNDVSHLQLD